MKFNIYYASGIGGDSIDENTPQEIGDFKDKKSAIHYVWEQACEDYDQYAGLHGIRDLQEIIDDGDAWNEDEAQEVYNDERENSIEYDAIPIADEKSEKIVKNIKKK